MGKSVARRVRRLISLLSRSEPIGGSQPSSMRRGPREDGEPFGHTPLHPLGQLRRLGEIFFLGSSVPNHPGVKNWTRPRFVPRPRFVSFCRCPRFVFGQV